MNPIWKAFDLVNSGQLRAILSEKYIDDETIQAIIDIIGREEYRLNRLLNSKKH